MTNVRKDLEEGGDAQLLRVLLLLLLFLLLFLLQFLLSKAAGVARDVIQSFNPIWLYCHGGDMTRLQLTEPIRNLHNRN